MNELWLWVCALSAFDLGNPAPLAAEITRCKGEIPAEFVGAISAIVGGTRRPNKKRGAKVGVPAADRLQVAIHVSITLGILDKVRRLGMYPESDDRGAAALADKNGTDPIFEVRRLEKRAGTVKASIAAKLGVSVKALDSMLRDLDDRIARWPEV